MTSSVSFYFFSSFPSLSLFLSFFFFLLILFCFIFVCCWCCFSTFIYFFLKPRRDRTSGIMVVLMRLWSQTQFVPFICTERIPWKLCKFPDANRNERITLEQKGDEYNISIRWSAGRYIKLSSLYYACANKKYLSGTSSCTDWCCLKHY